MVRSGRRHTSQTLRGLRRVPHRRHLRQPSARSHDRGEIFEGTHEPLISKKLFDMCQEVMAKRGKVRPDRKHNFAFLGLMKCASCDCSITAQYAKGNGGIYTYYRCTKKRGACQEKYLGENQLVKQIKDFMQKFSLSSRDTEKVLAALNQEQEKAKEEAKAEADILKNQSAQNETKLQKLLDAYLDNALTQQEYAAKKKAYSRESPFAGENCRF